MATVTIVSALDVDDDEGMNSLDRSRLTILSGSNCLNCGIICSFVCCCFPPKSSSVVSSNVIVFIIVVVVGIRFVSSVNKSLAFGLKKSLRKYFTY
jgi:hypothetical protein